MLGSEEAGGNLIVSSGSRGGFGIGESSKIAGALHRLTILKLSSAVPLEESRMGQRHVVGAACIGAALILSGPGSDRPVTSPHPIPLYEWEAKTLVLLVPDVQEALHEGYTVDVARDMTSETSKLNSSVYYAFRVNLLGDSPSSLLDYWGVNRFTGDVLHSVERDELENGSDLRVVQGVLRRVHNLTDDVLERYRKEPPFRR